MSAVGIKGVADTSEKNLNNLEEKIKNNKAYYNKKLWEKNKL